MPLSGVRHVEIALRRWRITYYIWPLLRPKKKKAPMPSVLFRFWKQHVFHLSVLLWLIYRVTWNAASFEWGPKAKALPLVQASMQAALPLGPHDSADPVVAECQWRVRVLCGGFVRLRGTSLKYDQGESLGYAVSVATVLSILLIISETQLLVSLVFLCCFPVSI